MRVNGEAFFLLNVWTDFLSLLIAARLTHIRFRFCRALGASFLGGGYALFALLGPQALRGFPLLLMVMLICTLLALGINGLRAFPAVGAAGLFFAGCGEVFLKSFLPTGLFPWLCAGSVVLLEILAQAGKLRNEKEAKLLIRYRGRHAALAVCRDSGNLLSDPVTGLPVIVAAAKQLQSLLPDGLLPSDLSTLPPGFRLIRVSTVSAARTLMCFHPNQLTLYRGRIRLDIDAVVAISDVSESRAILPEIFFQQEAIRSHAGL